MADLEVNFTSAEINTQFDTPTIDVTLTGGFTIDTTARTASTDALTAATTAETNAASALTYASGALSNVAGTYDSTATYSVGEYVIYDSVLYICTTAVETAGDFDSDYWTQVTVGEELTDANTITDGIVANLDSQDVTLTTTRYQIINMNTKTIRTAGGAFYTAEAISVNAGDIYIITCSGYGAAAAYAFGADGTIITTFPSSYTSTSEQHSYVDERIVIPDDVNELYLAYCTAVSSEISCTKKTILTTSSTEVINTTISETYESEPSTNPVRVALVYDFKNGRTYNITIVAETVNLEADVTNQILLNSSTSTGTSVSTLVDYIYTSGTANSIVSGTEINVSYTPTTDTIKSLLFRYKTSTGEQTFTITIDEVTSISNVVDELDTLSDSIDNVYIQSRMLMGAHRGAEHYAPPNSVAAYELAGQMGFPWAWLAQVRWSADYTLYVMHDEDVSVTTDGTGNLSELTDEEIDALRCTAISSYDYTQFTDDQLKVPTLEQVIQICLRYGMKMCFRIEPFPSDMSTDEYTTIWTNFATLIKEYGITEEWASYSGYNAAEMLLCRTLISDDVELCPYIGSTDAQGYIDFFDSYSITGNRAVLLGASDVTLDEVKLLHSEGIRVYAFTNSTTPTQTQMENFAMWGVDILQNPTYARIPVE